MNQQEQPVDSVSLPGHALSGDAFGLIADGQKFSPRTMTRQGRGLWHAGAITIRLWASTAPDGSQATVLEATGVRHIEEVCLLDHDIAPTPGEIFNLSWSSRVDPQQSTAVFLRDRQGGAFASWANPFGRATPTGSHLRMWYRPSLDVDGTTFRSDALVTGAWRREGREVHFEFQSPHESASLDLIAAKSPIVLDAGEVRAMRSAVARLPWQSAQARFNLLAAIAAGPSSRFFGFLPCWDADEWSAVRAWDEAFFAEWMGFARDHADVLAHLEDLFDDPCLGTVGGTIAIGEDGRGFVFLTNPNYGEERCEVPLGDGQLLRELHPEPGRLWSSAITVEAHEVHVCEIVRESEIARPALLGALGTVSDLGEVVAAKGRPGGVARVEALLHDDRRVASMIVFADDGLCSSLGPWFLEDEHGPDHAAGQPVVLADLEGHVRLCTVWAPGSALVGLLTRLAPPVARGGDERLPPWSDLSRLHLLIESTMPQLATVRATVDGEALEVARAYAGLADMTNTELVPTGRKLLDHYLDLTDRLAGTADPEQPWRIELELDGVVKGSLRGVHIAHLPRRTTTDFARIDLLGSGTIEPVADVATESLFIPGTTVGEILRAFSHRPDPPGAVFEHDIVYGCAGETDLLCSLYRRSDRSERQAAIVLVHGGGWASGDRGYHVRHAHLLAELGYVAMNLEYRLFPDALWPDGLEDVKCAVRFLRAHADELGIDARRIGIAGGSAGGHLAAMTALTPGQFEGAGGWGEQSSAVQAAVLLYPAVDLVSNLETARGYLAEVIATYFADRAVEASPVHHVHAGAPPTLTITGSVDQTIALADVERFHASLSAAGVTNRLEVFEGRDHAFDGFAPGWREDGRLATDLMISFFDEHLARE